MPELDLPLFTSAEDIGTEANVRITDAGKAIEIPVAEGQKKIPTFEIGVMFPSGDRRIWTINKTSQRALAGKWGMKTEDWVNKVATLFVIEQMVGKALKKVIYARVPK